MKTIDSPGFFILDTVDGYDWIVKTAYGTRNNHRNRLPYPYRAFKAGKNGFKTARSCNGRIAIVNKGQQLQVLSFTHQKTKSG